MLLHIALHFAIIEEWQTATEETKMTDKRNMISEIESLLGTEGTTELAAAMFDGLKAAGLIEFDGQTGYSLQSDISESDWLAFIVDADEYLKAREN